MVCAGRDWPILSEWLIRLLSLCIVVSVAMVQRESSAEVFRLPARQSRAKS